MKKFNVVENAKVVASVKFKEGIRFAVQTASNEVNMYGRTKYDAAFLAAIVTYNPKFDSVQVFTVIERVANINDIAEVNHMVNDRLARITNGNAYETNELVTIIMHNEMEYYGGTGFPSEETRQLRALKLENFFMKKYIDIVSGISEDTTSIEELDLSIRSYNCLKRAGVDTIGQLKKLTRPELARIRNLGQRSQAEVIEALEEKFGVSIG
ncbi:RNA polymerase subunit alpha [Bacillus phage vB_BmeM-Goe8]|uniref:RNA polymerase subunit alpha n=1 Tax=Bacillus phage vB_BmeM-Goe8 TaxID=2593638 RepID=A0A516KMG8_9CAUD|nr:RNA polymerase subunit alpha [Bacillus phage vB_BmeM-Goe8]YP_009850177.1 RNA polymerase subunit alpha [Bacillus phage vB_BmeM-Goe8]QDP42789.1 RNA polymerase subunit alpha [Bacillus phage vB_BmeM-Goe8]QDP43016.1 RNA polymerase subunit alpha [Bacillus phage vB_BmeM-Goe8]